MVSRTSNTDPFTVFICGADDVIWGRGWTPREACRRFWAAVWVRALEVIWLPDVERGWLGRECIRLVAETWPQHWHRALVKRGLR